MASGSRTSCTRWTRRPSTCVWRPSRGRRSGARKFAQSGAARSAWTTGIGEHLPSTFPIRCCVTDGKTGEPSRWPARGRFRPAAWWWRTGGHISDFEWLHQLQRRTGGDVTRDSPPEAERALSKCCVGARRRRIDLMLLDRGRVMPSSDQTIELTGARGRKAYPGTLRRATTAIGDEETQFPELRVRQQEQAQRAVGPEDDWQDRCTTIAVADRNCDRPAHFIAWIKQNLKVKRFVTAGRRERGVLVAADAVAVASRPRCMYLLLAYLKFVLPAGLGTILTHRMLRVLQQSTYSTAVHWWTAVHDAPRHRARPPDPQMLLWYCGKAMSEGGVDSGTAVMLPGFQPRLRRQASPALSTALDVEPQGLQRFVELAIVSRDTVDGERSRPSARGATSASGYGARPVANSSRKEVQLSAERQTPATTFF